MNPVLVHGHVKGWLRSMPTNAPIGDIVPNDAEEDVGEGKDGG